jgi:hypothetical protein
MISVISYSEKKKKKNAKEKKGPQTPLQHPYAHALKSSATEPLPHKFCLLP